MAANPQIWGDWPLWSTYPLWSSGATVSLELRLKLKAETEKRHIAQIQGSTTLSMLLGADSEKVGYQSARMVLPVAETAGMAVLVNGHMPLSLTQTAVIRPIIWARGQSTLFQDYIVADTERLGPVRKESFWGGGYRSIIYQTGMRVPDEADGATLKLIPRLEEGTVSRIEYGYGRLESMWDESQFWGNESFWGYPSTPREWLLWGAGLEVHSGEYIMVRIYTGPRQAARMCDLEWIFDVEDAQLALGDVKIPAEGMRVPVPRHYFRWISVVNLGLQFDGGDAVTAAWVDKGVIEDGGVVEGPFIVCLDKDGKRLAGNTDIILQGARGKNYGDVAERIDTF